MPVPLIGFGLGVMDCSIARFSDLISLPLLLTTHSQICFFPRRRAELAEHRRRALDSHIAIEEPPLCGVFGAGRPVLRIGCRVQGGRQGHDPGHPSFTCSTVPTQGDQRSVSSWAEPSAGLLGQRRSRIAAWPRPLPPAVLPTPAFADGQTGRRLGARRLRLRRRARRHREVGESHCARDVTSVLFSFRSWVTFFLFNKQITRWAI